MVLVLAVSLVGMAVALARGGRFRNLSDVRIKQWWLLPLAFALQLAAEVVPDLAGWSRGVTLSLCSGRTSRCSFWWHSTEADRGCGWSASAS